MEPIKQIVAKGKNVRIVIELFTDENGVKSFVVLTKRLLDFKTRKFAESRTGYTVETFFALQQLFSMFFTNDSLITNKILLQDLEKANTFNVVSVYLNKKFE